MAISLSLISSSCPRAWSKAFLCAMRSSCTSSCSLFIASTWALLTVDFSIRFISFCIPSHFRFQDCASALYCSAGLLFRRFGEVGLLLSCFSSLDSSSFACCSSSELDSIVSSRIFSSFSSLSFSSSRTLRVAMVLASDSSLLFESSSKASLTCSSCSSVTSRVCRKWLYRFCFFSASALTPSSSFLISSIWLRSSSSGSCS
mmetsp:Transcript_9680/g.19648  ORF Transcript_9680/g.19648 Transcript_9680/m.19648 type:complete len:202 (+) Transcript_9680:346-951(+)